MYRSIVSIISLLPIVSAYCPLYGPVFPAPTNLADSKPFQDALDSLRKAYDDGFATGNSSHGAVNPSGANGIQIFSLDSTQPLFEYYHDGTTISNSSGVRKLDGDAVFRVGSISKLITVYLIIVELGDVYWDTAITKLVPELKGRNSSQGNRIDFTRWEDITLGALAGQLAGVVRDFISFSVLESNPSQFGLPDLSRSEGPNCIFNEQGNSCSRQAFFESIDTRQPIFAPNTQPIYSNTAFVILGYALESITGRSFKDIMKSSLISPLGLNSTSYEKPDDSKGIIPFNTTTSLWSQDLGEASPMGGFYASMNDIVKIGRSILNSTLIDTNTTRAWMKPTSFISSLNGAVGRPWEIYRADNIPNRGVVDIYAKAGDIGTYHTFLGLVPDYNIGFVTAIAGIGDHNWLNGNLVDIVFPALEAAAREQADKAYAGTYTAKDVNSTLTLTSAPDTPGLGIKTWISNGTNFLDVLSAIQGIPVSEDNLRVYPTNLEHKTANGTQVAWRATIDLSQYIDSHGAFSACPTWFIVDALTYGDYAIDELLFNLGKDGRLESVDARAFKVRLDRQS